MQVEWNAPVPFWTQRPDRELYPVHDLRRLAFGVLRDLVQYGRATTDLEDQRMRRLILTGWKAGLPTPSRVTDDLLTLQAALAGED